MLRKFRRKFSHVKDTLFVLSIVMSITVLGVHYIQLIYISISDFLLAMNMRLDMSLSVTSRNYPYPASSPPRSA